MASKRLSFGWLATLVAALVGILGASSANAQQAKLVVRSTATPVSAEALLQQMSLAANVIFAGQVSAVRPPAGYAGSGQDAAEGVVEIDFRVDQVVRPASTLLPGSTYTLREWSGLWAGNAVRYKVGQRLLMFLRAPYDGRGLTSPVHGAEGAVPLRGGGVAPGPDDAAAQASEWVVDLRWLQAQVQRRDPWGVLPIWKPAVRVPPGSENASIELLPGVPTPLLAPNPPTIEVEPLAQVLTLCRNAIEQRDVQGK